MASISAASATLAPARHSRSVVVTPRARALPLGGASLGGRSAPRSRGVVSLGVASPRGLASSASPSRLRATPMPGLPTSGLKDLGCCVEAQQFDRAMLEELFVIADAMAEVRPGSPESTMLQGYLMSTLFYEPSTRTRLSFEGAMGRLGGGILSTESAGEYSSAAKGETLEDTIRTVEGYSDIIVLRHYEEGAARRAADVIDAPVINAGDGPGQHPTQALLDTYTIYNELGRLDDIKVGLVGDLANGRTVRSLASMLTNFTGVSFYFIAPDVVKMGDDIKAELDAKGCKWEESTDLLGVAGEVDVLYQTRIQKERFGDRMDEYEAARGIYTVDRSVLDALPAKSIVMHPLPRLDEIAVECDADPRAAYFRQARNGLFVRMALLKVLLKV
jgi:aspartate carbamoyltransferase catalytic subunit